MRQLVLYGSVWLALVLFVLGQAAQRAAPTRRGPPGAGWWLWCAGALLCVFHMIAALGVAHAWSHDAAVRATALQTLSTYGLYWGGGVYVNYAFVALWIAELVWWRVDAASYFGRPFVVTLLVRAFYLLILVNAAVVFAAPSRQIVGVLAVAVLLWVWRPMR